MDAHKKVSGEPSGDWLAKRTAAEEEMKEAQGTMEASAWEEKRLQFLFESGQYSDVVTEAAKTGHPGQTAWIAAAAAILTDN
jgi:hypothetical protein